jgi:crossover junction endonuclease EME1
MRRASFQSSLSKDAIEVDSDHEKEDTGVEKMGRKKQTITSKSTSLSADSLPKKKMSKDEKTRAAEEKKLQKEVSFFLVLTRLFCFLFPGSILN